MAISFNKEEITNKVKSGRELTREEEIYYMTKVLVFTRQEAEQMIAIAENNDKYQIID